jgi:hypothetical protein
MPKHGALTPKAIGNRIKVRAASLLFVFKLFFLQLTCLASLAHPFAAG